MILKLTTETSAYLFGAVGVVTCCVVGYATSLVMTEKPANIDGLTVYSMRR